MKNKEYSTDWLLKLTLAQAYFEGQNYIEASKLFLEIGEKYQAGFCELMMENLKEAREIWFSAPESEAIKWGRCLSDIVTSKVKEIPSFLQLRNHLEADLGYFIRGNKLRLAENVINCRETLTAINPECNKYIGKALLHGGYPNLAVKFLIKSQELIPNDPEIYYHLGQYSFYINAYKECINLLNQCIYLNPNYTPAKRLLEKVNMKLKSL